MGYVMFRTPDTYGHWGFVIKGNREEIATLIKVEGRCEFELYDQKIRKNIKEGEVVQIDLDWKTLEYKEEPLISSRTILNANEFKFL